MVHTAMMRAALVVAIAASVGGCVVQKTLTPIGGSRADGSIEMAYEVDLFEQAQVDWAAGAASAAQRCRAWGYSDAEPFGGKKTTCSAHGYAGDCMRWLVSMQYQCTGGATQSASVAPMTPVPAPAAAQVEEAQATHANTERPQ